MTCLWQCCDDDEISRSFKNELLNYEHKKKSYRISHHQDCVNTFNFGELAILWHIAAISQYAFKAFECERVEILRKLQQRMLEWITLPFDEIRVESFLEAALFGAATLLIRFR